MVISMLQKKVRENSEIKIALIKINGIENFVPAEIGDSSDLKIGSWVICGGHINQKGVSYTAGIILTLGSNFIQTDAAAPKDFDGGPMFDQAGRVIGVIGAGYENLNGTSCGIAIPVDLIRPVIEPSNK